MKHLLVALGAMALAAIPAMASEATFERTLSVNGRVELSVATNSGNIKINRGPDNRIHIFGRVKSGWGVNEDRVREVAAHPPIEQTGNIVRIGHRHDDYGALGIDYEIEAPSSVFLEASSGSGNLTDDGVGENAKLSTGSGNIHATGLRGSLSADTGSGDIFAEQAGDGSVKASTGSGNIELRSLHGGVHARTGSGNIKASGRPTAPWQLDTSSGNVDIWPENAPMTLDAIAHSGSIHNDREMTMQESMDRHRLAGKIGGGGPAVRISTGSGNIHIH
jgi:hypothetical protein